MAKKNAVNRGKGVMFNGKLVSPRLLEKRVNRLARMDRKNKSLLHIPYGGVLSNRQAQNNLLYLESRGLL